jgi:hypothetical protein
VEGLGWFGLYHDGENNLPEHMLRIGMPCWLDKLIASLLPDSQFCVVLCWVVLCCVVLCCVSVCFDFYAHSLGYDSGQ